MGSVHVDGVEDPLGELLQLGRGVVGLLLQPLVVLPQGLNLGLQHHLVLLLLRGRRKAISAHTSFSLQEKPVLTVFLPCNEA